MRDLNCPQSAHAFFKCFSFFQVFGIQFYGECWSGADGERTYSEYGSSPNCWKGVGGSRANYVYEFIDDKVRIMGWNGMATMVTFVSDFPFQ